MILETHYARGKSRASLHRDGFTMKNLFAEAGASVGLFLEFGNDSQVPDCQGETGLVRRRHWSRPLDCR